MPRRHTHIPRAASIVGISILSFPTPALAISGGTEAALCEWPSVVLLRDRTGESNCSGVYIGGRIVLTAAHCDDSVGYYYSWSEVSSYFGMAPLEFACTTDEECPAVSIEGEVRQLECVDWECWLSEADNPDGFYTNVYKAAHFGEAYNPEIEHPANAIPIQYCKRFAKVPAGSLGANPDDFAYCVLTQAPDIQPLPMIMPCEVQAYLDGTQALDFAAVGWGVPDPMKEGGTKRWLSTTQALGVSPLKSTIATGTLWSGLMSGDSGGPTFVKLPDGSWRLLGINVTDAAAISPWLFLDWILADPEVAADVEALLPCHDAQGNWAPGPGCVGFPRSPDVGQGQWSRGSRACEDLDVSDYGSTCGPAYQPLIPQPPSDPIDAPTSTPSQEAARGCNAGQSLTWAPLMLLGLLAVGRRRHAATLSLMLALLAGCQDDAPLTDGDDEISNTDGALEPLDVHPALARATSGIVLPGFQYDEIAVGNLARPAAASECCLDYVVGGSAHSAARVLFGGGSTTRGLTFLSDEPDQLVEMADAGQGIHDLELADVDGDGNNDLLVLTSNAELAVRKGTGSLPAPLGPLTQRSATSQGASGAGRMAVGQLDCDGDLDVVVTAPATDSLIVLLNNGSGTFTASQRIMVGDAPQDVAAGPLDANSRDDLVSVNGDGTMSIVRGSCMGGYGRATSQEFIRFVQADCVGAIADCVTATTNATVEVMPICGGAISDIAIAFADSVYGYCNDGSGSFPGAAPTPWDHRWDFNDTGAAQSRITRPAISPTSWGGNGAPALFAIEGRDKVVRQLSLSENVYGNNFLPVLSVFNGGDMREAVYSAHTGLPAPWWQRVAWVGGRGPNFPSDSQIGFAR